MIADYLRFDDISYDSHYKVEYEQSYGMLRTACDKAYDSPGQEYGATAYDG